jgi:hypothetical protein
MVAHLDQRRNTRVPREEQIEVTVLDCPAEPTLVGSTITCSTLDASATGLRLCFTCAMPDDAVLELHVGIAGQSQKCRLRGVVRWSSRLKDGDGFFVGVELQNVPPGLAAQLLASISGLFRRSNRPARQGRRDELTVWREMIYERIRFLHA